MHLPVTITDQLVLFWGGWPSQWFLSLFTIGDITYSCAEQFMMAEKARVFGDGVALDRILHTDDPREHKAWGRRVTGFDADQWNAVCRGIVYTGNLAKFSQSPELAGRLLKTGDRTIVEASPIDMIWGVGLATNDPRVHDPTEWRGTNWLGIAIMQVRDELRRRRGAPSTLFDDELKRQLDARAAISSPVHTPRGAEPPPRLY